MKKMLIWGITLLIIPALHASSHRTNTSGTSIDSLDQSQLNWYNLDPNTNDVPGAAVDKTYLDLLKNKKADKEIVVAVIDGGVDVKHEDLKKNVWINKDEIPGNGIDDDNNGYIDDVYGWNFIGNSNGDNVLYENLEFVRIIRKLEPKLARYTNMEEVPDKLKDDYQLYQRCKAKLADEVETYQTEQQEVENFVQNIKALENALKEYTGKEKLNAKIVRNIETNDPAIEEAKFFMSLLYERGYSDSYLEEMKEYTSDYLDKHLNLDYSARHIVDDNPNDIEDTQYGNNDVIGPDAFHGSFVAGIIAAQRNNKIGIDGIANNVKIMSLRAVPKGDEYDKDIALAIRYAVDNGAQIINMSFGKEFSPQKHWVDEALLYAAENNVLVVKAAGNDAANVDEVMQFPSDILESGDELANVITVGALSSQFDLEMVGDFSNFGRKNVDIFAPGVDLISLYPDNKYDSGSGTSFASPVVAGVAALVWSYYPELSAVQLKDVILKSANDNYKKMKVYNPDEGFERKKVKFKKLSGTGGFVNAYDAVQLADKLAEKN
ncbi:MAG: S8 family peptidase [Cyclobacteriaceae bacterium]